MFMCVYVLCLDPRRRAGGGPISISAFALNNDKVRTLPHTHTHSLSLFKPHKYHDTSRPQKDDDTSSPHKYHYTPSPRTSEPPLRLPLCSSPHCSFLCCVPVVLGCGGVGAGVGVGPPLRQQPAEPQARHTHTGTHPTYRTIIYCVMSMKEGLERLETLEHTQTPSLLIPTPLHQWNSKCLRRL
jgi:hypothetical protein